MRQVTQQGLDFIKRHEALRLFVYDDATGRSPVNGVFQGYPTIGYGHLIAPPETVEHYQGGITEEMAVNLLRRDLKTAEHAVLRLIKVPLSDAQFDALVSFTFNAGAGALQRSTLRRKLNRGDYTAIPREMMRWVFSKGRKLRGLIKRRQQEGAMFASEAVESPSMQLASIIPKPKPQQPSESWGAIFVRFFHQYQAKASRS